MHIKCTCMPLNQKSNKNTVNITARCMIGCKGGPFMTSGKFHQYSSVPFPVCLLWFVYCVCNRSVHVMPFICRLNRNGWKVLQSGIFPNSLLNTNQMSAPGLCTPLPNLHPFLLPLPPFVPPALKMLCLCIPPSYRLRPGFKDGLCTAAAVPVGSHWNGVPGGFR